MYLCRRCRFALLVDVLPAFILDTGITAIQADHADCINLKAPATDNETMSDAKSSVPIDLKCWAYVAGAPFGSIPDINPVTPQVELALEQGVKIAGKVNFFNAIKFDMIALIDIFSVDLTKKFMIDVEVEPIFFPNAANPLIQIGKEIIEGEATGGARFYVDAAWGGLLSSESVTVDIEGAIAFPFIRSYGSVKLQLSDKGLNFAADIDLFQGVVKCGAIVRWDWNLTSFYMELTQITFADVVTVNKLKISFNLNKTDASFRFVFECDISVLSFLKIQGKFTVATSESDKKQVHCSPP